MRIITGILITLLLVSCSPGPNYVRPGIEVPPLWRVEVEDGNKWVDLVWWEKFGDPTLGQLIQEAVAANRDLQLATARVEQYLGLLDTSRSQFFPQVGFGASATRQENTSAPFSTYQSSLNVSWELDLWGKIRRATEATQAQLFATEEGRRAVLVSLVANVASNNINLLGLDLQLEIARATEKSYAETLRIFRLRHQYGTISGIELRQIESQQEDALLAISNIKAQIALQENQLSTLLGRNPGPVIRGKTLDTLVPPPLPNVLPLTLLERRPDIRQAEYELIAANARIGEAKSLYFPTVSLSGLLGRQSSELADLFRQNRGIWSLGSNLAGPLVTFGALSGQVKQAEAVAKQAVIRYEQTIQQAFHEVEDALVGSVKSQEQLDAQRRKLSSLTEYARLSRLKFENGSVGYLQVLDAERSLFSAQLALVQTQVDLLKSRIALYRSFAGGWVTLADPIHGVKKAEQD